MELRHVRYFVAVAEEQNITRAAARLHVSQPPLSRQIRDLEAELGVELLERTPRAVRLTAAGWAFLEECYRVLRAADEAVRVAKTAATADKGELQLGYAPGPTQELLRELLRALRVNEPGIRVVLHDLTTAEMITGLRKGQIHAALSVETGLKIEGLMFVPLRCDPMIIGAPLEHRLARKPWVKPADLRDEAFVVFSRQEYPEHAEEIARAIGVRGDRLRIAEECDSGTTLFAAVEAGHGISLMARSLVAATAGRVALVSLKPAVTPMVVGLAYATKPARPVLERVVAVAKQIASQQSARA